MKKRTAMTDVCEILATKYIPQAHDENAQRLNADW